MFASSFGWMGRLASLPTLLLCATHAALGQGVALDDLARLNPGRVRAENALWIENALSARFNTSKEVTVADLKGPAVITMIHFAMPQTLTLNRDVLLRAYWDGEESPSVNVPLVDFFCDPAGLREEVNTALVNKRRGFNAYFPMPFRSAARLELVYDGPVKPGEELWKLMPCYSYVMVRTLESFPADNGYFHAAWRQEALRLGEREYLALDAHGTGKFVGWNVTMRLPGRDGYPVDQNEKFYIDGEETASVEFQGIEDSFGFSWGFPPTESQFPLTGFYRFMKGAAAYRFFVQDAISFQRQLRVMIGFGANEDPSFRREFSKRGNSLQFSSTVYWYQTEPHAPLPTVPTAAERAPAPEQAYWPDKETLPTGNELRARGVKLELLCGRPEKEVFFAEEGYSAALKQGYAWSGWGLPVSHCRADSQEVKIQLSIPKGAAGLLRLFIIDPDNFEGGRQQEILLNGQSLGQFAAFQDGRWIEKQLTRDDTVSGTVTLAARNTRTGSNAVISVVEWVQAGN